MERQCGGLLVLLGGRLVGVLCLILGDTENWERVGSGLLSVYKVGIYKNDLSIGHRLLPEQIVWRQVEYDRQ